MKKSTLELRKDGNFNKIWTVMFRKCTYTKKIKYNYQNLLYSIELQLTLEQCGGWGTNPSMIGKPHIIFDSTSCPLVLVGDWFQDTLVAYGY